MYQTVRPVAVDGPSAPLMESGADNFRNWPVSSGFLAICLIPWRLLLDLHSRMQPSVLIVIWNGAPAV
jgi:hypothetical protein